ncbi:hypothetical protein BU17DRAFT_103404 [Hysterangium stoloniferum]|nr:hypothetical protein BU17DRAFT_103404 [Hysterangium stoloniferum]
MDVWRIIHHQTHAQNDAELEEGQAGLGATLGSHSLHTGSMGTSPFLPTIAHVPGGPSTAPHLNGLEYRDSSSQRTRRSDSFGSTAMPVYSNQWAPSAHGYHSRSTRMESRILHHNFGEESYMSGPQTAATTHPNPEHPDHSFDGNACARRGSFIYFPDHLNQEHDRPMGSKSATMQYEPCTEMAREPEEVFANTTTLAQFPSPSATLMKPTSAKKAAKMKTTHSRMLGRFFTVSTSLVEAATMNAVFPTPFGKIGNVMRFISADSPAKLKICKLCYKDFKHNSFLTKHWLQVHAYEDLIIALTSPNVNHNELIINSTSRRDILLAAVYTCPLDGCLGLSQVGVFMTKRCLNNHIRGHCNRLKKLGQDSGQNVEAELQQLWEQFNTCVNKHPSVMNLRPSPAGTPNWSGC